MHYLYLNYFEKKTHLIQLAEEALNAAATLIKTPQKKLKKLGYHPSRREIQNIKKSLFDLPARAACYFEFKKTLDDTTEHTVDLYVAFHGQQHEQYEIRMEFAYQNNETETMEYWTNDPPYPNKKIMALTRNEHPENGYKYVNKDTTFAEVLKALQNLPFNRQ